MPLVKPAGYRNLLDNVENTEKAIKLVKDMFQQNLSAQLALLRVTAPMVVLSGTGINDDLNSVERPVSFPIRDMGERRAEVVHSLAKWKRLKLAEMAVAPGRGIYTDMNALRPDEELDNIHSLYVDQWDWEKVITREQRTVSFLKQTVRRIYEAIKVTENRLYVEFPQIVPMLPEEIRFIHAQRLLDLYPDKTPKERENPALINGSRKQRIAAGSGTTVQEVNRLLKQFDDTRKMMKTVAGGMPQMAKMAGRMKR